MFRFLAFSLCFFFFISAPAIAEEDHTKVEPSRSKRSGRATSEVPAPQIGRDEQKRIVGLLGQKPEEKDSSFINEILDNLTPSVFVAKGDPTPDQLRITNLRQKAAVRAVILEAKKNGKLDLVGTAMFKMMGVLGEAEGRKNRKAVLEVIETMVKDRTLTPANAREIITGDVRSALTSEKHGHYASWARNDSAYFQSTYDEIAQLGLLFNGYSPRIGGWYVYGHLHDKNLHRNPAAWQQALGTVRRAENLLENAELRRMGYFR